MARFNGGRRAAVNRFVIGCGVMLAPLLWGCAGNRTQLPVALEATGRSVTVRLIKPPTINLLDRGVRTLGVMEFAGGDGPPLSWDLTAQLNNSGAFRVVDPETMAGRLMQVGLFVDWEASPSALRWVHERVAVDAVVVGRLEQFEITGRDQEKQTLSLVETGEFGFTVNEAGKLVYSEKQELRQVPLYCRTDRGTVAASYRVWDARHGELVATRRHELSTEVPSFCYRGDVPIQLQQATQERLLRRLFTRLNERFLDDILPRTVRAEVVFEPLPAGVGAVMVQRNALAILYASRSQWQRAVEVWRDCLRGRPDLAPVHYNLGLAYEATGRFTLAREHMENSLTLRPASLLYQQAVLRLRRLAPDS